MQNFNENIDINTLKFLYERYKDLVIPIFVIIASIFIFVRVIVPSIFDLRQAWEKQQTELQTVRNMENKISLIKSMDDSTLDSQLNIVSKALPIDKDFESILNAIADASGRSGVSIASFKFSVGGLSEDEGGGQTEEAGAFPTLAMDVTVHGTAYDMNDFIGRLNRTLPFSEVSEISARDDLSNIKINFYYKRLARSAPDDSLPLSPVSTQGLSLINELSSNFGIPQSSTFDLTSTSSGRINPNPFE